MADEERLAVVGGVHHPQRDVVGVGGADLARRRVVDVDSLDVDDETLRRLLHGDVCGPGHPRVPTGSAKRHESDTPSSRAIFRVSVEANTCSVDRHKAPRPKRTVASGT